MLPRFTCYVWCCVCCRSTEVYWSHFNKLNCLLIWHLTSSSGVVWFFGGFFVIFFLKVTCKDNSFDNFVPFQVVSEILQWKLFMVYVSLPGYVLEQNHLKGRSRWHPDPWVTACFVAKRRGCFASLFPWPRLWFVASSFKGAKSSSRLRGRRWVIQEPGRALRLQTVPAPGDSKLTWSTISTCQQFWQHLANGNQLEWGFNRIKPA